MTNPALTSSKELIDLMNTRNYQQQEATTLFMNFIKKSDEDNKIMTN